jgi:hypothetical protein
MTSTSAETVNLREIARERRDLNLSVDDAREAETAFRLSLQEIQIKLLNDPTNSNLEAEHSLGRERLVEIIAIREASEQTLLAHNRIHPTDAQIASTIAAEELREQQEKQAALREAFRMNRQQMLEKVESLRALEEEGQRLREEAMREYPVAAPGLARWADIEEAFTPFPDNFFRVPGLCVAWRAPARRQGAPERLGEALRYRLRTEGRAPGGRGYFRHRASQTGVGRREPKANRLLLCESSARGPSGEWPANHIPRIGIAWALIASYMRAERCDIRLHVAPTFLGGVPGGSGGRPWFGTALPSLLGCEALLSFEPCSE